MSQYVKVIVPIEKEQDGETLQELLLIEEMG